MANPSRSTIQTEWANLLKIIDEVRRFGNAGGYPAGNATNFVTLQNTLETALAGDWLDDLEESVWNARAGIANILGQAALADIQRPFLRQYLKSVIGRTDLSNDSDMWIEMYKYFIDNSLRVQSRAFTFGTPSAGGSNVGTMQILRLTKDRYNFDIESGYVDSKRAICIADSNTGTSIGKEQYQLSGQASARDELERSGSGLSGLVVGQTIDDSLLINAGFRSFSGTAASPTGLTGWTSSAGDSSAIYTLDSTNYFRAAPSDGSTVYSLALQASTNLTQALTVRGTQLDNNTPYIMAVIWNRTPGSGSGTLTFRMGSVATTVSVAAQSGWQVTTVPNPMGQGSWYKNFAQSAVQIEVQWAKSSGTVNIAEVLFIPLTQFDGTWYTAVPTSATYVRARVLDSYTWPDIATGSSVIQNYISRGFPGVYLPHANGSSITWAQI